MEEEKQAREDIQGAKEEKKDNAPVEGPVEPVEDRMMLESDIPTEAQDVNGHDKPEQQTNGKYGALLQRIMAAVDSQQGMSTTQETAFRRLLTDLPLHTASSLSSIEQYVESGRRYALLLSPPFSENEWS